MTHVDQHVLRVNSALLLEDALLFEVQVEYFAILWRLEHVRIVTMYLVNIVFCGLRKHCRILEHLLQLLIKHILNSLLFNQRLIEHAIDLLARYFRRGIVLHFQVKFVEEAELGQLHDESVLVLAFKLEFMRLVWPLL